MAHQGSNWYRREPYRETRRHMGFSHYRSDSEDSPRHHSPSRRGSSSPRRLAYRLGYEDVRDEDYRIAFSSLIMTLKPLLSGEDIDSRASLIKKALLKSDLMKLAKDA
jgi:hypothetical protein